MGEPSGNRHNTTKLKTGTVENETSKLSVCAQKPAEPQLLRLSLFLAPFARSVIPFLPSQKNLLGIGNMSGSSLAEMEAYLARMRNEAAASSSNHCEDDSAPSTCDEFIDSLDPHEGAGKPSHEKENSHPPVSVAQPALMSSFLDLAVRATCRLLCCRSRYAN